MNIGGEILRPEQRTYAEAAIAGVNATIDEADLSCGRRLGRSPSLWWSDE